MVEQNSRLPSNGNRGLQRPKVINHGSKFHQPLAPVANTRQPPPPPPPRTIHIFPTPAPSKDGLLVPAVPLEGAGICAFVHRQMAVGQNRYHFGVGEFTTHFGL